MRGTFGTLSRFTTPAKQVSRLCSNRQHANACLEMLAHTAVPNTHTRLCTLHMLKPLRVQRPHQAILDPVPQPRHRPACDPGCYTSVFHLEFPDLSQSSHPCSSWTGSEGPLHISSAAPVSSPTSHIGAWLQGTWRWPGRCCRLVLPATSTPSTGSGATTCPCSAPSGTCCQCEALSAVDASAQACPLGALAPAAGPGACPRQLSRICEAPRSRHQRSC